MGDDVAQALLRGTEQQLLGSRPEVETRLHLDRHFEAGGGDAGSEILEGACQADALEFGGWISTISERSCWIASRTVPALSSIALAVSAGGALPAERAAAASV